MTKAAVEVSYFGRVVKVLSDNRYSVATNWGIRIEATYYRDEVTTFVVGDKVFLERVPSSELWMISSHAYGPSAGGPGTGSNWFQFDVLGFDQGHFQP